MAAPEDQVKKTAELKLWLESRIAELQEETERLKETLAVVDSNLRASTFKPALDMLEEAKEVSETHEIRRDKGGQVIANATVLTGSVSIEPAHGVTLRSSTPPFRSFLVGKILQGMKTKDEELVTSGKLPEGDSLNFEVSEEGGNIRRLTIQNYREKARLNEILNTVAWTFSRMLEK
jgi:hypothetical protein